MQRMPSRYADRLHSGWQIQIRHCTRTCAVRCFSLALPEASMLQTRSCCDDMTLVAVYYRDLHTHAGITAAAVLTQMLSPCSKLTHIFDSFEQM